jgi:hypothetical protein
MQIANMGHLEDDAIEQLLDVLREEIARLRSSAVVAPPVRPSERRVG